MQIIESCIGIVIISPISERVTADNQALGAVRSMVICRYVPPSVVSVRAYLNAAGVIYRNYVTLQILFEVVGLEIIQRVFSDGGVIYTYRATVLVIDKDEYITAPSLRYNSASVEQILIFRSEISGFARSYSVCIDYNITLSRVTFSLYCIFDTLSREFMHICYNVLRSTKRNPPLATVALLPQMWL